MYTQNRRRRSWAAGDTIGLVEVMKTFIEVKAEASRHLQRLRRRQPVRRQTAGETLAELED